MNTILASYMILASMMLHPGHSTRVELQYNSTDQVIEMAMRIDHSDLEAALRGRYGRPLVIEKLTDGEARELIAPYLSQTLRINGRKLSETAMNWVGWERKRISTWVYVEIDVSDNKADQLELTILTLLESEPELNHVVAVTHGGKSSTTVTSKQKPTVTIPRVTSPANQ